MFIYLLLKEHTIQYFPAECNESYYGQNCTANCGHCSQGQICNKTDGSCLSCEPGWEPPLCTQGFTDISLYILFLYLPFISLRMYMIFVNSSLNFMKIYVT